MWAEQEPRRIDTCDVVIVGAGLMGASVATNLARQGFDTAVLEARGIAGGATGRSAGMVLTGLAGHYNWAVGAYGRSKAQNVWNLTIEGRERLVEAAERLGVPYQRTGSLALALDQAEAEALEESAQLLEEDGFDVQFELHDPLGRGFHAALRYPDDVTVDATALTRALLSVDEITVHEGTEVYSLEPEQDGERDGLRVWAHGRTVLCHTVVLAINGYASLFTPYFTDKVAPVRSLALTTESLNRIVLKRPSYTDYGYEYCRQLPDQRLLIGGWRRPRSRREGAGPNSISEGERSKIDVESGLLRFMSRHFPDVKADHVNHWSGVMGFTANGLPLVGRLPDLTRVYFAVGLGGRGLSWALALAERVAEAIVDEADPAATLFNDDADL